MNYKNTFIQSLLIYCVDSRLDIEQLLVKSSISKKIMTNDCRGDISPDQLEKLWVNASHLLKDPLIGFHFGTTMQLAALNIVGSIIQSSNTVKDALQIAASFIHLLTDLFRMRIQEKGNTTFIHFSAVSDDYRYPETRKQLGDFLVTFTLYELKGLLLQNLIPIKVGLPNLKKEFEWPYSKVLMCPVYHADAYVIEVPTEQLKAPIISANYELQSILLNQAGELLHTSDLQGDFSKRIFNFLMANSYLYSLSLDAVANRFNMSTRKLQRQLKDEGISYMQIVEAVRKTLAVQYIINSSSSVKEISYALGYSESSAFVRAFKKWTGKSPSAYREDNKIPEKV